MFASAPQSLLRAALFVGLLTTVAVDMPLDAQAEKYQSRLNSLLLRKSDLYLPTRLILGQETRFIVKAQPGHKVRLFMSATEAGYVLPNGTSLRVGTDVQELSGVVPENGVLELTMSMPQEAELEGQVVYIDAAAGPTDEALAPMDLVDATGRRTAQNSLVITKQVTSKGPALLPGMPGFSPQAFQQLTTMGEIYTNPDDSRKQLLDNGDINRDRQLDQNPFLNRGMMPGLQNR